MAGFLTCSPKHLPTPQRSSGYRPLGHQRTYSYGYSSGLAPDSLLLTAADDNGYTIIECEDRNIICKCQQCNKLNNTRKSFIKATRDIRIDSHTKNCVKKIAEFIPNPAISLFTQKQCTTRHTCFMFTQY